MFNMTKTYLLIRYLAIILTIALVLTGCAMSTSPVTGTVFSNVKAPVTATGYTRYHKVGTASAHSILGIVALGDASIQAAMENGDIKSVHHADYQSTSFLGLYARYKVIVYGD